MIRICRVCSGVLYEVGPKPWTVWVHTGHPPGGRDWDHRARPLLLPGEKAARAFEVDAGPGRA